MLTFNPWVLELWCFTWVYLVLILFRGYLFYWPYDLDLGVWPFFENFNLTNNFWTVRSRAFILHMIISCDNTRLFDTVTLTLEFDPFFENFNLAYNFWTVGDRALIFHISIPCDKTFPWVPLFFYLVTLTWEFDLLFKNLDISHEYPLW